MTIIRPNTDHNADIVITKSLVGYTIWAGNEPTAKVDSLGMRLILTGAQAMGMTVYSEITHQFIAGTIDQLDREVEA